MNTAMGRVNPSGSIYPTGEQYSYMDGTQGNAARQSIQFTSQENNPDLKNKLNDTLYRRIAQQIGIKDFSSWNDVRQVEDFLAKGGSSEPDSGSNPNSNSTPTSAMANANDFYEAALTVVGGDKAKLDALQSQLGYNNINSAREVEQIRMHYNAQNAPAQQPAAQQPAQQPANQTFNPADYAPTNTTPPVEEPTYLEQKTSEYEATPQASVYDDFLKAIQARDAKVASGEAGPLDSIDKVASDSGERSWDSYAKEWGVSAPGSSSTSTGAGRMAGGDDFMGRLLAAGGVAGYADSGNQDKRRYMN
jgi:hypothetical protein